MKQSTLAVHLFVCGGDLMVLRDVALNVCASISARSIIFLFLCLIRCLSLSPMPLPHFSVFSFSSSLPSPFMCVSQYECATAVFCLFTLSPHD